jgi:chemotaxis protein MotB
MSSGQEDVSSQPLVIVRRRRSTDEEHHGGVWKIAYADFMTAMMAFFLVMWLINAADKKTIVQVAAYFNPMRLTDRVASPKGLEDVNEINTKKSEDKDDKGLSEQRDLQQKLSTPDKSKESSGASGKEASNTSASAAAKDAESRKEEALFDNPGQLLDKLADEAKTSEEIAAAKPPAGNISDPFDRRNRRNGKSQAAGNPDVQTNPASAPAAAVPTPAEPPKTAAPASGAAGKDASPNAHAAEGQGSKQADSAAKAVANVKEQAQAAPPAKSLEEAVKEHDEARAKKLQSDISAALSKASRLGPEVEVKATSEGLLVSLLDDASFGMFEVGSAQPRPELVLAMSKVGDALKAQPGSIVIRGHTDSRAYKNGNYDNWRLSAARAQMAYYMLLRGGIPESRFIAIEGRADRDPKILSNTEAPENRRIDILIKEPKE